MAGNRKYGYMRSNHGGFKPIPWKCDRCNRIHNGRMQINVTLAGEHICDKEYNLELNRRFARQQGD